MILREMVECYADFPGTSKRLHRSCNFVSRGEGGLRTQSISMFRNPEVVRADQGRPNS